jgi:hypothetical protein
MAPLKQRLRAECRRLRRFRVQRILFGRVGLLAATLPTACLLVFLLASSSALGAALRVALLTQLVLAAAFNAWFYLEPIREARSREKTLRRALRAAR